MEYKKLGASDLEVSVVGLGTWAMGSDFYGKTEDSKSILTIQQAIDSGINLIDTAPAYGGGHSEEVVGKAIEGRRDDVIIATKCGAYRKGEEFVKSLKPELIRKQLEDSLTRLNVEVIDLYQIHWPDKETPLEDSVNELLKLKKEGKFKYLGISNFDEDLISEIIEMTDIVSLQPQYSLLSRDIEEDILPCCIENNIGVISYGSLGGGILTGKYNQKPVLGQDDKRDTFYPFYDNPYWDKTQSLINLLKEIAHKHEKPVPNVAINWIRQQQGVTTALVGAKTPKQAEQNAAAGGWKLSEDELEELSKASKNILG
ncbi:aryl-alcohol dehydrogenase-like predicted oxidoreductase [Orenia metallireducens]|uniref:Predicted oxidoreductase n=1 Tax=Orenia metallireducens TaxID=1413210 RepID=A0A285H6D7_9FIRM|nr:aldo/keto reductase [Orenia metallireducens]PRX28654.1 aryl-alcohol dehydrogenase-like predicted oxidoreductase [Orenia metallireducens]SNY31083.1 Predicted oxidoreductase [Orenia metallireducens]